jgi:hypothetical protein
MPNTSYELTRCPVCDAAEGAEMADNLLGFPYRQAFTRRSLGTLLEKHHFEIVDVFGDTFVPIADRWTTAHGAIEERVVKGLQHILQRGWMAPWVEVYARPKE